jgi:hypothetical protein
MFRARTIDHCFASIRRILNCTEYNCNMDLFDRFLPLATSFSERRSSTNVAVNVNMAVMYMGIWMFLAVMYICPIFYFLIRIKGLDF